jgi:hypothetical protein
MESDDVQRELAAWLRTRGHNVREVDGIIRKLEGHDQRTLFKSLVGEFGEDQPFFDQLVCEVREEIQDENQRELLRWLTAQQLSPRKVMEVMRRLEEHDLGSVVAAITAPDGLETDARDPGDLLADILADIADEVLDDPSDVGKSQPPRSEDE